MFIIWDIGFFGLSLVKDDNIFNQLSMRDQDFFAQPFQYLPGILGGPLLYIDLTMNNRQAGQLIYFVMKFHYMQYQTFERVLCI